MASNPVASNTIKNKTGARGLHSELERVLLPHMYNLAKYSTSNIKLVKITEDLVNNPIELKESHGSPTRKVSNGQ